MTGHAMRRALMLVVAVLVARAAQAAVAALSITRAELNGGQLRVEGRGHVAGATVTVSSPWL
jgi:hypothetical protein